MGSTHFHAVAVLFCVSCIKSLSQTTETTPPQQHLEITGRHILRISYDYATKWPGDGAFGGRFYLPMPPKTGCQTITQFTSSLKGQVIEDSAKPPHRILNGSVIHVPRSDRDLTWHIEVVGDFVTRQLKDGPPGPDQPAIVPPPAGFFLASTESINWKDDAFQNWLDTTQLRRAMNETAVQYAGRVYTYCTTHGAYSYPPQGGWTSSGASRKLRTDCGGFSLVFAGACRANRIPARLMVGQWFKTTECPDGSLAQTGRQAHVIAEFFDPQIGWIPEDISSTLMKTPGYSDFNFFGRDPGYFFTWHLDTDFYFNVPMKADDHVQWIQNPSPWFNRDSQDAGDSSSHHWTFETVK